MIIIIIIIIIFILDIANNIAVITIIIVIIIINDVTILIYAVVRIIIIAPLNNIIDFIITYSEYTYSDASAKLQDCQFWGLQRNCAQSNKAGRMLLDHGSNVIVEKP